MNKAKSQVKVLPTDLSDYEEYINDQSVSSQRFHRNAEYMNSIFAIKEAQYPVTEPRAVEMNAELREKAKLSKMNVESEIVELKKKQAEKMEETKRSMQVLNAYYAKLVNDAYVEGQEHELALELNAVIKAHAFKVEI